MEKHNFESFSIDNIIAAIFNNIIPDKFQEYIFINERILDKFVIVIFQNYFYVRTDVL